MSNSLLIVGKESYICYKICERLSTEGREVVTLGYDASKYAKTIAWNRRSYISTKTASRELLRTTGIPSEIFIVFGAKYEEIFPSLSTHKIDEIIDGEVKSTVHLIQELYRKIIEEEADTSIYFISSRPDDPRQQLSHAVSLAIKGYCQAVMHSDTPLYTMGFELQNNDEDGFVDYILKMTSEHSEKKRNAWLSFPKPGLFSGRH
ncbi:MAG: hypothetical protein ACRCVN_00610 [Spirochaetia bacterium]